MTSLCGPPDLPPFEFSSLSDRLLAGRAPLTRADVAALRERGVRRVLDLRERAEWSGPGQIGSAAIAALAEAGLDRLHIPVRDLSAPSAAALDACHDFLARSAALDGATYVHCRGGRERTAAVLVAHLAWERGWSFTEALDELRGGRSELAPLAGQRAAVEAWLRAPRPGRVPSRASRVRGCLLGGAVGDALGAPIEFRPLADIRQRYGADGLREYVPVDGRRGAITDDTQMTLFTIDGLIRFNYRGRTHGITPTIQVLYRAYLRWLATQGEERAVRGMEHGPLALNGWLLDEPGLHSRRAPGRTCLGALRSGGFGTLRQPINDSKGCGGVMRVAPVGLYDWPGSDEEMFAFAAESAALTHGHPSGYLAAGALAVIVRRLRHGEPLLDAAAAALAALPAWSGHEETTRALERAPALAASGEPSAEKVERVGGGWVAEEALAIGLYAALVGASFEDAVCLAANHSGDSDSTASICGQILGARDGVFAIPLRFLRELELRAVMIRLADDFVLETSAAPPEDWGERYLPT